MDFIFYIPLWQGLLFLIIASISIGVLVVYVVRKLIEKRLTKQHERVGRLLFRVSAGLIALLISLSYANERAEHIRVRDSMEKESALIANVFLKLEVHNTRAADTIKTELIKYVEYTISDKWETVNDNPYHSKITETIVRVIGMAYQLVSETDNQTLAKNIIINELNEVVNLMQVRFYAKHALMPYLVYILGVGMLIMWIFFAVYTPDVLSLVFLSLYNTFLVILIYFIIMLSNPMVGTLKIDASSFEVLKTKGFDRVK